MSDYDLSMLIPARNEMFLARTVEDILKHRRGKTEILVGLDGAWAEPGIPDHPDVRIIYVSESIGQRAMTNKLCKLSRAKYVAKCDAHTAYDEGFDVKLMDAMKGHDDWTIVPIMRNLHAFDWVCKNGHRRYQGPSGPCNDCGEPTERDVVWYPKPSPQSTSYRFDKTLHFQYFNEFKKRPEGQGDITPSMSLQGSFFMLTRDKYWQLNICDEGHGSWGQQGVEVALKTWLSGGKVMCVQKTWYAHMFRTQGGDFGFPYPLSGKDVDKARKYSRVLWLGKKWPLAKHDVNWLLDKFGPVPEWHDDNFQKEQKGPKKGIIFYTDNQLTLKIAHIVQRQLLKISKQQNISIVSASLKPMGKMGKNIVVKGQRGYLTMFKQILAALEASDAEIIFFCEHDNLYHPSHFEFTPPKKNKFYYDWNWWKVRADGLAVHWDADQVSGLCCYRDEAIKFYKKRIAEFDEDNFDRKFEPLSGEGSGHWRAPFPSIDIRHQRNLTYNKWGLEHFRKKETATNFEESTVDKIPGWDDLKAFTDSLKTK